MEKIIIFQVYHWGFQGTKNPEKQFVYIQVKKIMSLKFKENSFFEIWKVTHRVNFKSLFFNSQMSMNPEYIVYFGCDWGP